MLDGIHLFDPLAHRSLWMFAATDCTAGTAGTAAGGNIVTININRAALILIY